MSAAANQAGAQLSRLERMYRGVLRPIVLSVN
jgi:hypothetical protein